jgi:hypothetical protein
MPEVRATRLVNDSRIGGLDRSTETEGGQGEGTENQQRGLEEDKLVAVTRDEVGLQAAAVGAADERLLLEELESVLDEIVNDIDEIWSNGDEWLGR